MMITAAIGLYYINKHHNILCSNDEQYSKEKHTLNRYETIIDKNINIAKLTTVIMYLTLLDTWFIYENQLKSYFNSEKTLICSAESKDINSFEASNKEYIIVNEKYLLIPSRKVYKKVDIENSVIDLDFCELKNKKWYE